MAQFLKMQERNDLADLLNIPRKKLTHLLYVRKVENCYHTFFIPKRSGGEREIAAPDVELKSIQKNLANKLQQYRDSCRKERDASPNIAHAFERKKGIITNARIHRNKRFVLNIDLEDFFGSIHFGRVKGYFEKNNYFRVSREVATVISQLCCYEGKLPQGAPTSPVISNMVCEILDYKLLQIAKKYKLDYTRYADDLTFSTNDKNFLSRYEQFYASMAELFNMRDLELMQRRRDCHTEIHVRQLQGWLLIVELMLNMNITRKPEQWHTTCTQLANSK